MEKSKLNERLKTLERVRAKAEKAMTGLPEGKLRIAKKRKSEQYFWVTDVNDKRGRYLKKTERELAKKLAEKSYLKKLIKELDREINAIRAYVKAMEGTRPEEVFDSMNRYRQKLVEPLMLSDKEYAEAWEKESYDRNPYCPEECIYETKKGDMVRSKSEMMIADMYYELGIPYRYEAKVTLKDGRVKYPDFTLLLVKERELIYHEHMGMFEEEMYRKSNIIKISDYALSGISVCNNLIITFETDYAPLNIKNLRGMVKNIFISR